MTAVDRGSSVRLRDLELRRLAETQSSEWAFGLSRGNLHLLVRCRDMVEVVRFRPASPVPGESLLGAFFFRGRPITAVDPRTWDAKVGGTKEGPAYWVVVSFDGEAVGLAVDSVAADVWLTSAVEWNPLQRLGSFCAVMVGWKGRCAWCLRSLWPRESES